MSLSINGLMRDLGSDKLCIPSPLEQIQHYIISKAGVELWIKRDDLIHPILSGNKWRKIKPLLEKAKNLNAHTIMGIGGAYSNLLHALAYAGYRMNLKTIGCIRGHYIDLDNPTLKDCKNWKMQLRTLDKKSFQHWQSIKHATFIQPGVFFIPLGGTDPNHLSGVEEMMHEIYRQISSPDYVCVPIGSGGTMAGMIRWANPSTKILGFSTFKQNFETEMIQNILGKDANTNWEIIKQYPKLGFGKVDAPLLEFIRQFHTDTGIQLDTVYNGKMMHVIMALIASGAFKKGSKIVAIHSGGTQGLRSSIKN